VKNAFTAFSAVCRGCTVGAQFFDRQDAANPLNGTINEGTAMREIIECMPQRRPFLADLISENGRKLLLGLGSGDGLCNWAQAMGHHHGSMRGCEFADRGVVTSPVLPPKLASMPISYLGRPFNDGGSRANNKADASRP
jgi:hypothetical protein